MTLSITHTTPADGTFSATGAAAWNATHSLGGVVEVAQGGTGATSASGALTNLGAYPASNPAGYGTGTVTSVTGTAPVVSSGGATPAISMAAATGSVSGYLTSADWNTFNGKYSVGGALGTPSSGTVTNLTGTASIDINGSVGATTQSTGAFTTLRSTGSTLLGGASGFEQVRINPVASRLQYILFSANTTSNIQKIGVVGSSNLGINCETGSIRFCTASNDTLMQFVVNSTASAVNYVAVTGAATGGSPVVSAEGSDTNINLRLTPKGTGTLQFGTYTSSVITQTGYITITDAGGTSRRLLVG